MKEGKTSIPSWAFVLIGASMMVYSKFIESKAEHTSLAFFFYIGLAVVIIGLGKVALKMTSKKEEKTVKKEKQNYNQNLQEKLRQQQMAWNKDQERQQQQTGRHQYIKCAHCGTPNYAESDFCGKCGKRIR